MRTDNPLGLKPFDAAEYLTDEETVAEYLNAAAEIGDPAVLLDAFAAVGRARGMADLARKAGLGRESLYKALAPDVLPESASNAGSEDSIFGGACRRSC